MRRFLAVLLVSAMSVAIGLGQTNGASVSGIATNASGRPFRATTVRLRDLASGYLVGTTTTTAAGTFALVGVPFGTYVVEVVGATGHILCASAVITVASNAGVAGVAVTAPAAAVATAAGAAVSATSTVLTVTTAAITAGVAAAVAANASRTASPSR